MSGPPPTTPPTPLELLKQQIRGGVIEKSDSAYAGAHSAWNHRMATEEPSLIIQCLGTADVVHALAYIRETKADFTVAAGRHSVYSIKTDCVMLDLGRMRGVIVDPRTKTAIVQAGTLIGDYDTECGLYGLHSPMGTDLTTGFAGLTLGGGVGMMSRRAGLSMDNILEVEVVLADGRVVNASATENADLFWGIRGSGFNFGVVTRFTMKLLPVGHTGPAGDALNGLIAYGMWLSPLDNGRNLFCHLSDLICHPTKVMANDFGLLGILCTLPTGMQASGILASWCGSGDLNAAMATLAQAKPAEGIIMDTVAPMPYPVMQGSFAKMSPPGNYYERSAMVDRLSPELAQGLVDFYRKVPTCCHGSAVVIMGLGGAVANFKPDETAFRFRSSKFIIVCVGKYETLQDETTCKTWVDEFQEVVKRDMTGSYTNSFDHPDAEVPMSVYFNANMSRLADLKAKYDPFNFFHNNKNVKPSASDKQ